MRRQTIRPASRRTLVFITWLIAMVIWICWEVGRAITRTAWWRTVVVVTSGLAFVLFAIGDLLQ